MAADRDGERRHLEGAKEGPPEAWVREEDLEPHAGLRYIARLFKVLAILLVLLLIAEVITGLSQQGTAALPTLMQEATQLVVFAAFLWAAGDITLMLIESNHDLRATRILLGRLNKRLSTATVEHVEPELPPRPRVHGPPDGAPPQVP